MSSRGDRYEIAEDGATANPYGERHQILALSGGGYRGLFSADLLARIEQQHGPAKEHFDIFAGTSIGAILAGALALGVPAKTCRKKMIDYGDSIFPTRGMLTKTVRGARQLFFKAPYSAEPLAKVIEKILGDNAARRLSDIEVPLLIPCVSHTRAEVRALRSRGLAGNMASDVSIRDAMLASAAAPTYFPARTLGTEVVIDGGVAANSPELIALTDAIRFRGFNIEHMHILSIGTASESLVRAPEEPNRSGVVGWMARRKLFQVSMECQSGLAVSQCSALLGDRYLRMDQSPEKDQATTIGLDVADANAVATLLDLAEACRNGLSDTDEKILGRMFRHNTG